MTDAPPTAIVEERGVLMLGTFPFTLSHVLARGQRRALRSNDTPFSALTSTNRTCLLGSPRPALAAIDDLYIRRDVADAETDKLARG